MTRLKVLLSAFACRPNEGSELGLGWNMIREIARHHELWVLTQDRHRPFIEEEVSRRPMPGVRFVYYRLPGAVGWWRRGQRGIQTYYYLWQIGAYRLMRALQERVGFDVTHHVTFAGYWKPSLLSLLPVPFVWGPVGGGEDAPRSFRASFGVRGLVYEDTRDVMRFVGEHDPLVRITARKSRVAFAATEETASRLEALGARDVRLLSQVALSGEEIEMLRGLGVKREAPFRFASSGRLLHWKGFHLGLAAFARADIPGSEYLIFGDGPHRKRLQRLAVDLGLAERVRFMGGMPREKALRMLGSCQVFVHPSLHESGGWVCAEAMAIGLPLLCLDIGGPARHVVSGLNGYKVAAGSPKQVVDDLAEAMRLLWSKPEVLQIMSLRARRRVGEDYDWRDKGEYIAGVYREVVGR
ncbi:glycosyltransferase [Rubrobacter naiadicus]|uniref:glycosyltransferase n=1 Tax=Rubrobacter naiadicus TaxID=1392641 RepID=UPI002360C247|nr:glycosyltransferase [Rubrobacter naiadicus]